MDFANATFSEILDDLSSRFIINVPEEELASVERICFQIEQAHWFYEDFVREQNPSLPSFNLKNFSAKFFKHCPLLHQWSHEHEKAFADFMQYKIRVPVCGAIMLNDTMEKCVLVKGWSSRAGWGFPKGKINKDEPDSTCAAREVLEETGYDISPLIKEQDYIELTIREQRIRLYIVVGVREDTKFCPKTRKEISRIEWHKVADLPTWIKSRDRDTPYHCGGGCVKYGSSRFYMVVPFVSKLRNWLRTQRKKKIACRAAEILNREESTEVVIFNGTSNAKETSPETSVPGTESEGSPHEQSPNIGAQPNQFSPHLTDSQNILKLILCLNRSTSTQPTNNSISLSQEQSITSSMQFKQIHSYFSPGLPINQLSQTNAHPATTLPYQLPELGNLQTQNSIFLEKLNANHSQKTSSKGISRSNSQTPIPNKHDRDITAPIPIHANTNVSLLNLFTGSTSTRPSSSVPSVPVEHDTQRRNSLLNVLQPETSVVTHSKNLTHDDIVQHQLQQSKIQYFPDSCDAIKISTDHIRNDTINMFQHHNPQNNTFMRNLRDPIYNESSSQNVMTSKMSSKIGHIGQGRPNNNDNSNREIHEVARKMSLLGLFSTASNSGTPSSTGTRLYTNNEFLLQPPPSQSKPISPKNVSSSVKTTSLQIYGRAIDGPDNREASDKNGLTDGYPGNYADPHDDQHVLTNYDGNGNNNFVPDLRVRYELLDRIHELIPSDGTELLETNLRHTQPFDKKPMTGFKFNVEKIVAALQCS